MFAALSLLFTSRVSAATITWNNTGTEFGTGTNWTGGVAPADSILTDIASFGTASPTVQPGLTADRSVAGIVFANGAGTFTLSGANILTLGASGIVNSDNSAQTVSVALKLGAAAPFTTGSTGALAVAGTVNTNGFGLTLNGTGAGASVLSGVISGTGTMTKSGTGTWTVSGNNTSWTGNILLSAGTLTAGHNNALGTGTLSLNGGTLSASAARTLANPVTIDNNSTLGGTAPLTLTNAGGVTLTGSRTLTVSNTALTTFTGALGESGGARDFTKAGAGNLLFTATSTYTGNTTVTAGSLQLGAAGTISGANLTLNGGVLAQSGTFSRALGTGVGQVQFGASGGGFSALDAALAVTGFTGTPTWASTASFLPNAGTLTFGATNADAPVTWSTAFSLGTAARTIFVNDNTASSADYAKISGVISSGAGGALTKTGTGLLVLDATHTYTGATTISAGTLALGASGSISNLSNLVLNGGTLGMAGAFSRALGTGVSQVRWSSGGGFAAYGGPLAITGFTGTPIWASTTNFLPNAQALLLSSTFADNVVTWTNDFSLGAAVRTITVTDNPYSTADAAVISGVISNTAAGGLTLNGTGTLTLAGANTFSGLTTISNGTVNFSGDNSGAAGGVTLSSGTLNIAHPTGLPTGTLTLSGGTLAATGGARTLANPGTLTAGVTIGGTNDLTLNGTFTTSASLTLTLNNTGTTTFGAATALNLSNSAANNTLTLAGSGNLLISGVIANGGTATASALTKSGPGTVTLSGANTYDGLTTVSAGTLNLNGDNSGATGGVTVSGGTIDLGHATGLPTGTLTLAGGTLAATGGSRSAASTVGLTAASTIGGSEALTFSGAFSQTGSQTLTVNNAALTTFSGATLTLAEANQTRTLTLAGTGNVAISSIVQDGTGTGADGFTKTNSGTLTLSGANTFTGALTLSNGLTRATTSAAALGAGTLTLNAAALELAANTGLAFNRNTTVGGGATIRSDTLTANPGLTHTLGTLSLGAQGLAVLPGANVNADSAYGLTFGATTFSAAGGLVHIGNNGSGTGTLTLGALSGNVTFTKQGSGTLLLNTPSTRTGSAQLDAGTVKLGSTTGLGAAGQTLTLNGATLDLATDTSVVGYPTTVASNSTVLSDKATAASAGITHTLGTLAINGSTLALADGANVSDGTAFGLTFGATTLNGSPIFDVANNGAGTGTLTLGALNDQLVPRTLGKSGAGTLTLSAAATSLAAGTVVNVGGGTLSVTNATALGTLADVNLRTGATLALGAALTVSALDGPAGSVTLGANPLTLGNKVNNLASTFGGVISGTGAVAKNGTGTLTLTGANLFSGAVTLHRGLTLLSGADGAMASAASYTLRPNATLTLNNTGAANNPNRLGAVAFTANGGTFNFTHDSAATASFGETIGALTLNAGGFTASLSRAASGQTSAVTAASLPRNAGGTLLLSGAGLGADARNQFLLTTAPTLTNATVPWAAITTDGGATYHLVTHASNGSSFAALPAYNTGAETAWTSTSNARPATDQTLSADRNVSSLVLDSGVDLLAPTADRTITFTSGGGAILQTGGVSLIGASGANEYVLAFGATEGIFHTFGTLTLQRGDAAGGITGSGGITKTGTGTLVLQAGSANTGATRLNAGTLRAETQASALGTGAATLQLYAGTLELAGDSGVNFARNTTVGGDVAIASDTLTGLSGVTHTLGTLSIGDQTLALAPGSHVNPDTSFGLTFGATTLSAAGAVFDVSNNGAGTGTLTLGALTGNFLFTKTGAGTLALGSTSSRTGSSQLDAGTLRLGSVSGLGAAGQTLTLNGGILDLATDTTVNPWPVTIRGNTTILSDKATAASAGITHTLGTLSISANTLTVADGPNVSDNSPFGLTFGTTTLAGAATVDLANNGSGAGTLTLGALAGNFSLTKQGGGTLVLGTAATRATTAGSTTLSAGTLRLTNAASLNTSAAAGLALNGGTLQLANNTGTTFTGTAATIGADVTLQVDRTAAGAAVTHTMGSLTTGSQNITVTQGSNFSVDSAGSLTFGATTLAGNPTFTLNNVNGAGIGLTTLGALHDNFSARTLTKNGAGTLVLSGAAASLVNGTTVHVNAGTLSLTNATALGTLARVNLAPATTLSLGAATTLGALNGPAGAVVQGANQLTLGNPDNNLDSTFGGVISGATALTKNGTGTLTLTGANAITGAVTLNRGLTLIDGANGAIAATGSYTLRPNATLTLNNTGAANNSNRLDPVAFTANGGTFNFTHDAAAGASFSETIGALTLNAGAFTANLSRAASGQTSAVTVASLARNAGGTLLLAGSGLGADTRNQFLLPTAPTLTNSTLPWAAITTDGGATYHLVTHGGNASSFAPLSSYSTGSQLTWEASSNVRPPADVTLFGPTFLNNLVLDAGIDLLTPTGDRTITFSAGGGAILQTGGTSVIGGSGALDQILAFGATEGIFHTFGTLTLQRGDAASGITGSGGITKTGSGTLVLQAGSANSGATRLNAGTLRAETQASALGAGALELYSGTLELAADTATNFGRNTTVGGDVTLKSDRISAGAGLTQTLGTLSIGAQTLSLVPGANVSSGTAGLAFGATTLTAGARIDPAAGTQLSLGALSGNFLLTKIGSGTLALPAASTRTGGVQIDAGTLALRHSTGFGASQTITLRGGTLDLATDDPVFAYPTAVLANSTILSDKATAASPGITHLLGTLSLNASTLSLAAGANVAADSSYGVAFGATTLTGNATLDVANNGAGTGTVTLTGPVGESGGARTLTKEGAGALVFDGPNTLTGGITLAQGTLTVDPGGLLAAASASLVVNGGTLNLNHSAQTVASLSGSGGTINFGSGHVLTLAQIGTTVYAGVLRGAGHFIVNGGGTLTLSGGGDYSGPVTVQNGSTLRLGADNGAPATAALTFNSGTLDLNGRTQSAFGSLTVGAAGGTIDFGSGLASTISFSDSSANPWSGTLTITNYTTSSGDSLRFGVGSTALTASQLAAVNFIGFGGGATIDGSGFVSPTAVPESAAAAVAVGAAALLYAARRRRASRPQRLSKISKESFV